MRIYLWHQYTRQHNKHLLGLLMVQIDLIKNIITGIIKHNEMFTSPSPHLTNPPLPASKSTGMPDLQKPKITNSDAIETQIQNFERLFWVEKEAMIKLERQIQAQQSKQKLLDELLESIEARQPEYSQNWQQKRINDKDNIESDRESITSSDLLTQFNQAKLHFQSYINTQYQQENQVSLQNKQVVINRKQQKKKILDHVDNSTLKIDRKTKKSNKVLKYVDGHDNIKAKRKETKKRTLQLIQSMQQQNKDQGWRPSNPLIQISRGIRQQQKKCDIIRDQIVRYKYQELIK